MTTQLDLLPVIHLRPEPTAERDRILRELEVKAGERFTTQAKAFVLAYLREHGPSAGEDVTDACIAAGIKPETSDTRAFGPIYASLSRKHEIVRHGYCIRRKGHATAGGIVWKLGSAA